MFQQVDIDLMTDSDLLKLIKVEGDIPHGEELKPWVRLSKVFTDGLKDEHLHIIVKRPAGTCNHAKMLVHPVYYFLSPQAKLVLLPNFWIPCPH
jgi:hypothetical protein